MRLRTTSIATPVAHLIGPGKIKVVNGRLAFSTQDQAPLRLDPRTIRSICCYGGVGVTDEALRLLFRERVDLAWFTPAGNKCRGRITTDTQAFTGLRLIQHRVLSGPTRCMRFARTVVLGKIDSQMVAARHHQRHGSAAAQATLITLSRTRTQAERAENTGQLLGLEGAASNAWFKLLGRLLYPPWEFKSRTRRPPTDPVNALLSLGYTWLLNRTIASCTGAGLEVGLGAFHTFRPGRPSLACDLMEPLRILAVDRWVLTLCNESRLSPGDFRQVNGGFQLTSDVFPRILVMWEEHWHGRQCDRQLTDTVSQFVTRLRAAENGAFDFAHPPEQPQNRGEGGRNCNT